MRRPCDWPLLMMRAHMQKQSNRNGIIEFEVLGKIRALNVGDSAAGRGSPVGMYRQRFRSVDCCVLLRRKAILPRTAKRSGEALRGRRQGARRGLFHRPGATLAPGSPLKTGTYAATDRSQLRTRAVTKTQKGHPDGKGGPILILVVGSVCCQSAPRSPTRSPTRKTVKSGIRRSFQV